ncbi:unnamed protein product [Pedinophyceae sp. YPF-701]|nr:unnamed protein product [Pedinophyceae sp. YPF-701]
MGAPALAVLDCEDDVDVPELQFDLGAPVQGFDSLIYDRSDAAGAVLDVQPTATVLAVAEPTPAALLRGADGAHLQDTRVASDEEGGGAERVAGQGQERAAAADDFIEVAAVDGGDEAGSGDDAALREATQPRQLTKASGKIRSPLVRLHSEIVELARFLTPLDDEVRCREEAVERVAAAVQSIWPTSRCEVFGSFAAGLFLPTSDIDLVVLESGCGNVQSALQALANLLSRQGLARATQVIGRAKVPIVKFTEVRSGFNFDVSFDAANGPEAASIVRGVMTQLPMMRPLTLTLKIFLQQRELNEVYTGGIGSYALLTMVASFLLTHPDTRDLIKQAHSRAPKKESKKRSRSRDLGRAAPEDARSAAPQAPQSQAWGLCLGSVLCDFFLFYGRLLNVQEVGVSARKGGAFFSKRARGFFSHDRPYLIAVEDPNDKANDLGRNSFNFGRVRAAFEWAYQCLTSPAKPTESLLGRIVRLDPVKDEALIMRKIHTDALRGVPPPRPSRPKREPTAVEAMDFDAVFRGVHERFGAGGGGEERGGAGGDSPPRKRRREERAAFEGPQGEMTVGVGARGKEKKGRHASKGKKTSRDGKEKRSKRK